MGWLRRLFHKRLAEKRLDAELRFHLEQRVRDYVASGMSLEEARRRAHLAFGGLEQIKQDCREARIENHVEDLLRDFQYALRSLAKDRRFALIAVVALALGIAATTVMFSVIYNVVFDPFPYRDFQHSVTFEMRDLAGTGDAVTRNHYTIPEFLAIREQNHVFEDMIGNYQLDVLYTDGKGTRRLRGGYVTTNGFDFLGVPPLLGRVFSADDEKPSAPFVFMMNYGLWQTQFGGDSRVLGTTFFLNGKPRTLVGIMPPRFNGYDAGVWLPLSLRPGGDGTVFHVKDPNVIWALARLKKGVSVQAAAADLDAIVHRLAEASPGELYPQQFKIVARTLLDFVVGDFKKTLYALLAAVFMLLLIACINVGNMLLARGTVREREIAVRASLGASRGRLIRQLLVESFVLAAGGLRGWVLVRLFWAKGFDGYHSARSYSRGNRDRSQSGRAPFCARHCGPRYSDLWSCARAPRRSRQSSAIHDRQRKRHGRRLPAWETALWFGDRRGSSFHRPLDWCRLADAQFLRSHSCRSGIRSGSRALRRG